ncbi:PAS domain S-box-containing protein [Rhizobiales bacterium GAS191]|nr:PAS domain S-box-containing protein [Rhizobiales bacterium GAS191]
MTEPSAYVLTTLREGEFTLYRNLGDGPAAILLVAPAGEHPSLGSVQRLEHEYALRADLDANWAARPVRLIRPEGRLMLVLEDPGGEPLERLLGQPLEVAPFLRIAVPLAAAVGQVHARGLIHKDIKPANVLVDMASGGAWLTGFGIASRLPREHQAPAPPEVIAGTLAYMAPEQTGRMNRSIDARSDLYSFGVTLYEMLTGVLPFTASDPMEWIHCHIARQPIPPSERAIAVPAQLSAIVMKLLAKTAEERYQTAAGVEADLRRCLAAWESLGRIDPFPLGAQDASDRLIIPERLYGREREINTLLAAFDRVVAHGTTELVLVSGYSGIGKSSVVHELHKSLVPPRGLFASGKFDQYKRDIPYATLAQAFQSLVRQILVKSEAEMDRWRRVLAEAVEPNGQLIVNLVPELELIIGKQPPVADLSPQDAQNRFQMVFRRFLGVFARKEHPLALFLDDLQWLDTATLDLLQHLVTHPEVRHLLLVGAYRHNEVGPTHPLMRTLKAIRKAGARVEEIVLAPLGLADVGQLIGDAVHCEPACVRPLAQLVQEKTEGNPFFAIQFFTALAEEGLLAFDPITRAWQWNMDRIGAKSYTDNVVDLMAGKVSRLPGPALFVLKQLACLGNVASTTTMSMVLGAPEGEIHAALWEVVRSGLVFLQDGAYAFLHDRVQEAAYALIPEAERAATHLRIGRVLASQTAPTEFDETIFEIVNQLDRGADLIDSPAERDRVAAFNLAAGKRAKASTAYASALTYFTAGRMLLGPDGWARNHRMRFDLELYCAECEFRIGEPVVAQQRLSILSEHAASLVDRAAVTRLQLALYTTLDRSDRAIEVGLGYLRDAGVEWSRHPTDEDVRNEYERMRRLLAGRPLEQVLDSPLMSDTNWRATMDVLADLMPPLLFTADNLHDLALLRMANISLEHGNCDASCYAYARLMRVLGTQFADYQTAFRFGQLACDLVDQRGLDRFKARVYMCFGIYVSCWFQHLAISRVWITRALDAANASGDLTCAMYASKHLTTNLFVSGEPLRDVEREIERGLAIARKAKFGLVIDAFIGELMMIRSLRGLPPDVVSPDHEGHGEDWFKQHLAQSPHLALPACWYWIHKLQTCFFARDHVGGLAAAAKAAELLWSSRAYLELAEYHMYAALVLAAACDATPADSRHRHLETLYDHHRQIMVWAESCPANFENCAALVGAEIARLQGRELYAQRLYEQAIQSARKHGFVQNEALAHEVAGRFYAARGFQTIAHAYLRNARYCYLRWGAEGKVRQLEQLYPHLCDEPVPATAMITTPVEQLDVVTIVKASQAVSGEIVLENLIKTLMVIAVEHVGAERGLLVLPRGDQLWVEAEATTGLNTVEVNLRQALVTSSELPDSVLQYVVRTQEPVILDDASKEKLFSADSYILQKHARSVLCLPLIKQTKLVGVLYIENNLAASVFTPARIVVLKLLSSQAAISLDNARLYAALRRSEASLTEAQEISHTGSWRWKVGTGEVPPEVSSSVEFVRIFGFDPAATQPSHATFMERIHPEDRPSFEQALERAVRERSRFQHEYRIALPDGSVKHLQSVGQPDTEARDLEFVGTVMDVTERKRAEEALRNAQAELARVARLTTMGELAASIAHEINQPLTGVVTNGNACLRWLNRDKPDLDEARNALSRIVSDGTRAGEVIRSLRALAKKSGPQLTKLDINDAIQEVLALTRSELRRHGVTLHTELSADDRPVFADRVQLQQVLLNLIMNGVEAMSAVTDCPKMLAITSEAVEPGGVLVAVEDTGTGLDPATADRIFEPFFTTKPSGLGMGLSICRSIINAHGGRFWASPGALSGTVFRFTVPGIPSS